VATSGIAGPGGGSDDKPVGTIWFAVAGPAGTIAQHRLFSGLDRRRFKRLAAWSALALVRRAVLQTVT
jgi:nicotinamide mononucleotide (NMN) deamidase PncC